MDQKIVELIFESIEEVNAFRPRDERLEQSVGQVLMGEGGTLDSLGLTNLVIAIEERVEEAYGRSIALLDESTFDEKNNPFATVDTLAKLIGEKIR